MRQLILVLSFAIIDVLVASKIVYGALLHSDDFQSGNTEGWVGSFVAAPVVRSSGGPAGDGDAFLMVSTSSATGPGSHLSTYNRGPDWVGDYASLDARSVSVDLMSPLSSSMLEMRLVLFGPQFLSERWTSSDATLVPNDGIWRQYRFSLAEEDLTQFGGSSAYSDMFRNVVRIMLRHDPGSPSAGWESALKRDPLRR